MPIRLPITATMKIALLTLVSFLSLTISAFGHPVGHDGNFLETAGHVITHPSHILLLALSLGLVAMIVRKALRTKKAVTVKAKVSR